MKLITKRGPIVRSASRIALVLMLACIAGWMTLLAHSQRRRDMSRLIYSQNWSKGASANAMRWNFYRSSVNGGSDTPDSLYPEIASSEAVDVVVGAGPAGENVLDYHIDPSWTGIFPHSEDYVDAGIALKGIGSLSSPHYTGWWNATKGHINWQQKFTTQAWHDYPFNRGDNSFTLLVLGSGIFFSQSGINIVADLNGTLAGDNATQVTLSLYYASPSATHNFAGSKTVARSGSVGGLGVENVWQSFKVVWQAGTVTNPVGPVIASDGWLQLWWNGQMVVNATGIPLCLNSGNDYTADDTETPSGDNKSPAQVNWLNALWFGYAGLFGPVTNIELYDDVTVNVIPAPVPLAPQAPCNPQAQISGGGKGLSGCNVGGVGWVSQYSGPYGSVPQHDDPVDGETLTGKAGVDIWIELIHTAQDGTQTTYRRSLVELADASTYEGGRKSEGLKTIGAIDHGLSNEQGSYAASTVTIGYADMVDRLIRILQETEDLEYDTVIVKMASSAARAAGSTPRVLQRAIIQTPELQSQMDAILTAVDALFADFGPYGPNRQWPNPIPQLVGFTTPADVLTQAMPWIYGEKSDEGATDPATNKPISKGLVPLKLLGQETISRTVMQPDTASQPPYDATIGGITGAGVLGQTGTGWSGPINTDPFFAIAPVRNGKMGPLVLKGVSGRYDSTPHNFRPVWNVDTPSDYYFVFMYDRDTAWDANTNPYVSANPYYKIVSGTPTNPYSDWQFDCDFTSRTDGTPWPPAPLAGGPVTIEDVWDVYLLAAHPIFRVLGLYGSDQAATTVDTTATGTDSTTSAVQPDRAKLDIDSRGDVLVPGYANWPFATSYREYVAVDGKTYWLTVILAKGPLSDNHKNGVITLAANVIGVEDVGDGTGLPIIDAGPVEQHWRENALLNNWTAGLWCSDDVSPVTTPRWPDGTPMVRSSSFRDWQAFTATAYGGRGLTVGWAPDTIQAVSAWEVEWIRLESRTGINGHGQVVKWWLDETQDPTTWPALDHVTRVFGPVKRSVGIERQNSVTGSGDWDPDASRFRMGPATYTSATGIARYKGHTKSGDPVNSTILNDPAQFAWVLNRRLSRLQYGAAQIELEGDLGLLDYDVGSGIQFTSIEGTGETGYADRPLTILRRKINLDKQPVTVTYTCLDMRDLLIATVVGGGAARTLGPLDDETGSPRTLGDESAVPSTALVLV